MDDPPRRVEHWLNQWSSDQREQAEWLAGTVRSVSGRVEEGVKWGRLTFTVDGNWHHWLCAVTVTGKAVGLMFHKGSLLDDPAGLLQGNGRYLRQVSFDQARTDREAVTELVRQAIVHQTDTLRSDT